MSTRKHGEVYSLQGILSRANEEQIYISRYLIVTGNQIRRSDCKKGWQDLSHPMGTVSFLGPLHTCRRGRGRIPGRVRSSKKEGLTSLREFMVCDKIQP